MKKEITLQGKKIQYSLISSMRSRALRLSIKPDGEVVLSVPYLATTSIMERFIHSKATWILKHLEKIEKNPKIILSKNSKQDFILYKEKALRLAKNRLEHFNSFYNLNWKSISIRNQKTRWGSCSKRKALSFNYKIALLDSSLCDYIIVHELCHLQEFNHSPAFWALVAKTIPDYKALRKQIQHIA